MIKRSILAGMMAVNLLVASGVHAADMSFVFQRPLTLKGETSDSFLVGGGYGQRINQDWSLNADLSWLQVQSSASLSGALGYQILGGYRFDLGYPISFDGLAGVAGNGHSGIGIALGARAVYPFGESSSFGVELLYNTNRDFSVGARFSKWVSIPDIVPNFLGGKPAQLKQTATPPVVTTVAASKPAKAESEKIAEKEVKNANDTASTESGDVQGLVPVIYKDITTHWARKEIEWAAARGLFGPSDKFAPSAPFTGFANESTLTRAAEYLKVKLSPTDFKTTAATVTKAEFTVSLIKLIGRARTGQVAISNSEVATLATDLSVPDVWWKETGSSKPINRAEAAVIVTKILQAQAAR